MDHGARPKGWRVLPFREIAESITERVDDPASSGLDHYVGLEHLDPDTTKISRWGSPSDVEATKLRFYPGDVIYARRRAYQRKLGVAEWKGICSAHALVLRARPEACIAEFLPYFLQSDQFHLRALDISVGSLSPTINWKTLAVEKFSLPPKGFQSEVIAALGRSSSAIDRAVNVLASAESLKGALIEEATWNRARGDWLVPLTPTRHLLLEPPRNGISPPSGGTAERHLRSVSISAVQYGRFVADANTEKWCEPIDNAAKFEVRAGDAFGVRGNGNRKLVGRVGLAVADPEPPCIYPDLLIRLRFDPSKLDPMVATAIWNSPRVHARLLDRAKSSNGIYKVNGQDISAHLLPIPPLVELVALEERLRAIDHTIEAAVNQSHAAAALMVQLRERLLEGGSGV